MRFDVLTLFPEIFSGYLRESILAKSIEKKLVDVQLHNFRDWTKDKHHKIDDRPYGGGPGMIMMVEPVVNAVESVWDSTEQLGFDKRQLILLSPTGERLDQKLVEELATCDQLALMCGRYEGFDNRVNEILQPREVSIGDYILNGGETAAMVLIDSVIRLLPGVLGDEQSGIDDSFSSGNRWLEHPQYTRPPEFRGHSVPEILTSGNHQAIAAWRTQKSAEITKQRRKDLLDRDSDQTNDD